MQLEWILHCLWWQNDNNDKNTQSHTSVSHCGALFFEHIDLFEQISFCSSAKSDDFGEQLSRIAPHGCLSNDVLCRRLLTIYAETLISTFIMFWSPVFSWLPNKLGTSEFLVNGIKNVTPHMALMNCGFPVCITFHSPFNWVLYKYSPCLFTHQTFCSTAVWNIWHLVGF